MSGTDKIMAEEIYVCRCCGQDTISDTEICRVCNNHRPRHKESKDRSTLPRFLTDNMRDANVFDDEEYNYEDKD